MPYKNSADHRENSKSHYQRNKQRYLDRNKRAVKEKQAYLREVKSRPCEDCNKAFPYYVMDLDHRPEEEKLFEPAKLVSQAGWDTLRAEIAKCDVVCSNCHRERTFQRSAMKTGLEHPFGTC